MKPVSIKKGTVDIFHTFNFTPTGLKMNCMSKINFLFVITFVSRKIEI